MVDNRLKTIEISFKENSNKELIPPPKLNEPVKFDGSEEMEDYYKNMFAEGDAQDLIEPLILENLPSLPPFQQRQIVAEQIQDLRELEHKIETK